MGKLLARVIRARYTRGVLELLDKVDLSEGEIVSVIIEEKKLSNGIANIVNMIRKNTPKIDDPVKVLEELRK